MTITVRVGGIQLELPDGAHARDLSIETALDSGDAKRGRRPLPRGPIPVSDSSTERARKTDPVVESLRRQDMELVGAFEIDLPDEPPGRKRVAPAAPTRAILDLAEGEDAIVLLQTDDVYEWRLNPTKVHRTRSTRRGAVI